MNILLARNRDEFRDWLASHSGASECWVDVKRGRPADPGVFYYLDAVEEALAHLIEETKRGRMSGEWTDYGR